MKFYQTSDSIAAKNIRHLLILNSECISLKWSRFFKDISEPMGDALDTITDYIERKIPDLCGSCIYELTDGEEQAVLQLIKTNEILKASLGSGVVLAGTEADLVYKYIQDMPIFSKMQHILESGNSLVLF